MTDVSRLLVTGEQHDLMRISQRTSFYANWIESRDRNGRETYLVTVWGNEQSDFLDTARETGVTVEQVIGADETEEYILLIGAPGTGWEEA
jgi:hypothetical protein